MENLYLQAGLARTVRVHFASQPHRQRSGLESWVTPLTRLRPGAWERASSPAPARAPRSTGSSRARDRSPRASSIKRSASSRPMNVSIVEDAEPDSLEDAIVELRRDLSANARWALVNVAGQMVLGANQTAAIQGSRNRRSYGEARLRLELPHRQLAERAAFNEETKPDAARLPREAASAKVAENGQHNNDDDDDPQPSRHVDPFVGSTPTLL